MSASSFFVFSSSAFDRSLKRLARKNRAIIAPFELLVSILRTDPYNLSRRHDIKKLTNMGEGQWRIRYGVYRLRYDIEGNTVKLHSINHRSDAYDS